MAYRTFLVLAVAFALAGQAVAQNAVQMGTPTVLNSACDLAKAMTSKLLGGGPMNREAAEKMCRTLQPKMGDKDAAEFMRCCMERLAAKGDKT
jgi:hypothetical protein